MMQRSFQTARECAVLAHYSAAQAVIDGVSNKPTPSDALMNDLDRLDKFERDGGAVLSGVLMSLPPERFHIPLSFPCGQRFVFSVTGAELIDRLNALRDRLSAVNPSVRPMYLNYVIRYVLRCGYALSHENEFRDVLIVAGDAVPADAPAVYDPYRLMFPYRPDPRNSEGIDPSIFDQSDLFPNGKVDAEGFADDSELF